MVELLGIEPRMSGCKPEVFPLNYSPTRDEKMAGPPGFEPGIFSFWRRAVQPVNPEAYFIKYYILSLTLVFIIAHHNRKVKKILKFVEKMVRMEGFEPSRVISSTRSLIQHVYRSNTLAQVYKKWWSQTGLNRRNQFAKLIFYRLNYGPKLYYLILSFWYFFIHFLIALSETPYFLPVPENPYRSVSSNNCSREGLFTFLTLLA